MKYLYCTQLTIGLGPNKPIISWKCSKSNMHWIHLTYRAIIHLTYLKCTQNTSISLLLSNYLVHLKCNHPHLLTRSWRHRWVFCRLDGMQNYKTQYPQVLATKHTVENWLFALRVTFLTRSHRHCLESPENMLPHITSPEKIKIQSTVSTECV